MNRLHFLHHIRCCLNEWKYVFPWLAFLGGQAGYKDKAASSHLLLSLFGGESQPVLAALYPTKQPAHGCGVTGPHIFWERHKAGSCHTAVTTLRFLRRLG